MSSTMLYTVGTALSRARDHGAPVQVLVSGHWISGRVTDIDSQGVVLAASDLQHAVVRVQDISAVRIDSEVPEQETPTTEATATSGAPHPSGESLRMLHAPS